ncbi:MAG: hypothetical protein JWN67_1515 [Actinomycetia bacterium]|nr:hypothetical protein [Actinomycetes bacterium]
MRPAPVLTEDNHAFWDAAAQGRLVAQRCGACGRLHHPPRPACPECHAVEQEVVDLAGTGTIYSYAVLHHPRSPQFTYPLVAVLVDLDEGPRIVSNLVGVEPADVRIGMAVRVSFEPTADDLAVPVFVPAEGAS